MSVSFKVLKSSALILATNFFGRALGIIGTLICARILTPFDFGIIALMTICVHFFDAMANIGSQQYISQKGEITSEDINTAWTLDIASKTFFFATLLLLSPILGSFFEEPKLTQAVIFGSLIIPIQALKNPDLMRLTREIDYRLIFILNTTSKFISFAALLSFAVILKNYWAFILSSLIYSTSLTLGSYLISNFRPSFCFKNAKHQWHFSRWLFVRSFIGYIRSQIDTFLVSKNFDTSELGGYNTTRDIALLPAISMIAPMVEPLLATVARSRDSAEDLAYRVRLSLSFLFTILIPIATFILLYPNLIVEVLLGKQWLSYSHLMVPFSLYFFTFCLFELISNTVIALGKVRALFIFDLTSTTIIAIVLINFATDSLLTMAWYRGGLAILTTILLLIFLNQWTGFGHAKLLYLVIPAIFGTTLGASLTMTMDLGEIHGFWELAVRGSLFLITSGLITIGTASLMLRKTQEWRQIQYILKQLKR